VIEKIGAQERTRTSTTLRPLDPESKFQHLRTVAHEYNAVRMDAKSPVFTWASAHPLRAAPRMPAKQNENPSATRTATGETAIQAPKKAAGVVLNLHLHTQLFWF
jgi:hypothetical protein